MSPIPSFHRLTAYSAKRINDISLQEFQMSQAIILETRLEVAEKEIAGLKEFVHRAGEKQPWEE